MNQKFLIVLFVTIFYNGVINASPVSERITDSVLPEEKPPTASPPHTDNAFKKVELSPAPTAISSVPITQNTSAPLNHTETSTVGNTTAHSVPVHVVSNKTSIVFNKPENDTQIVDNKTPTVANNGQNNTQSVDSKTTVKQNATVATNNTSIPSDVHPASSSTPSPSPSTNHTSAAATTLAPTNPTTTKVTNASTVEVTTTAPNSTVSEKVVVVHNVPTPAQENHFDGPSFIGGIVLTIGLTAIGFIAFKYYKSGKIDMNYRTL